MKRARVLCALIAIGACSLAAAGYQQPAQPAGPKVVEMQKVKDNLYVLRGGGGNFGVVTEFEFRLHPIGTRALVAELEVPFDRATAALRGWRDLLPEAPREATLLARVAAPPPGGESPQVSVGFVWVGEPEAGRASRIKLVANAWTVALVVALRCPLCRAARWACSRRSDADSDRHR